MMGNSDDQVWLLLQNDRFIKWVNNPDRDTIVYWDNWIKQHPDQQDALFKATQIVMDLAQAQTPPEADDLPAVIWDSIQKDIDRHTPVMPKALAPIRSSRSRYLAAAAITGLLILGTGIYSYYHSSSAKLPAQQISSILVNQDLKRTNLTAGIQVLYLMDGSKVILEPGSSIRQALFFQKDKREIYLEGNAFFDVAKDARRPFYVYTKDLVVRVLGTSFNVTTDKSNGDVTVLVQTGKVAVSKKVSAQQELVLEPNQQVLYRAGKGDVAQFVAIKQGMGPQPVPVAPDLPFDFEETPVTEIFKTLEKAYGIPLFYEEKTFSACVVTTSLTNETFEEKLKIICEAIGAAYRINDNGVSIEGKPCTK